MFLTPRRKKYTVMLTVHEQKTVQRLSHCLIEHAGFTHRKLAIVAIHRAVGSQVTHVGLIKHSPLSVFKVDYGKMFSPRE